MHDTLQMSGGRNPIEMNPWMDRFRPLFAWSFTLIAGIPPRILYRLKFHNRREIPKKGPVLLAANHVTWVDPVLIMLASTRRPVRFLVTQGFHKKPFVYFFCWLYKAIPIKKDQPRDAINAAIEALKQGDVVCIFPEGGLTHDGELREIRRGVELIARKAGVPVLPLGISGLHGTSLAIRRQWRKTDLREKPWPRVDLTFGKLIPSEQVTPEAVERQLKHCCQPQ
jgi:1-acyl-sn-glycerol-3-phosphate acyltransferase